MTEGFGPKVPGFDYFEFGNHKKMKKPLTKIQRHAGRDCYGRNKSNT